MIREKGFTIFTDHKNLTYIFNPAGMVVAIAKPQADRLEHWAMFLRCFTYKVKHIAGDANVWADMLSRWGATGSGSVETKTGVSEEQRRLKMVCEETRSVGCHYKRSAKRRRR